MVSERSRDGKMMIGFEKNMEIEEGEASYYQNGDETNIDPDVTMSYIDEKIQDILGQFQKDFEGGVSAENLGAKFGWYGSFLPTCARSPARSQQRTALEVIDGNTTKSPRILDPETSHLSLLASSCPSLQLRHEFGSTANPKGHGSINGRVKGGGRVPLDSVETPTLNGKPKSEFPYDQRTLKVRLRVGSNDLPAGKNEKIYSGLGLDGSPSPSLNDSYTDSEWLSHDLRDLSGNSPTSILKIMTSFLLQETQLLSPLSEELICFTENEKYSAKSVSKPMHKRRVKGCESRRDVREPLPEKKPDSYETSDFLESGGHRNEGLLSVVFSTGVSKSAHNGHMFDQQTSDSGGRKKQQSKNDSSRLVCGEPLEFPKSMNKNHQEKNIKLDFANQSSAVDAFSNQYVGQCSSSLAENHTNKPHNKSLVESCSVGGDAKKSKTKKRRQSDSDSSRSSKKVKPQDVLYNGENGMTAPSVHLLESGNFLDNSSPNHMPRKNKRTINGHRKDENALLPNHKCDDKSSSQKNICQGEQGTHPYVGDLPRIGHQSRGKSEDNERKVKKARPSHSEGKVAITRNSTSETDQKATKSIDKKIRQERDSSATTDSLQMDLDTTHPSVASTSNSCKVSGSCKIKTDVQEVKGSPVESVSSSPLRVLSTDKCGLTSRNLQQKDYGDGTFVDCSPKESLGLASNKVRHSTSVESSVVDLQDKDPGFLSFNKIKEENKYSSDFATHPIKDASRKATQDTSKNQASERYQDERKDAQTFNGGSHTMKLENGMSLHHGNSTFRSENDKVHITAPDSKDETLDDISLSNEKLTGRSKFQESSASFDEGENSLIFEKGSGVKDVGAISDCENKSTPGYNDRVDDKLDMKEGIVLDRNVQNASKKLISDIRSGSEISGSAKSNSLPPSARSKNHKGAHLPLISGPHKEKAVDISLNDAHGDTSKAPEQNNKIERHNGSTPSRHSNATMHKVKDQDGSSVRKDSRSQAATNAMKEAKDLKRLADRFKNSGSADSTGMYFEAALKFLYGSSLLEAGSRENNRHNDIQCIDMYRSTAKFCEFCAHEYERSKDMASAALAYKCMEVSYMRVIYSSHGNSNNDRNEVQMALQIVRPGESPASSASDVDNLNNPITVDKVSTSKATTSPQVAGNTGITSRNRSSFTRLLEIAQDSNAAMDAARKSRASFKAANLKSGDASISTVKKALDFNFQDVEGLLRLVRIAKDAVSH
ncbi:hypothetical protein Leryth_005540 [Lithospermum erythrorhizon]|nr:hypothetical protein Leryth_005540 [Lithospermum erythrorhizon]